MFKTLFRRANSCAFKFQPPSGSPEDICFNTISRCIAKDQTQTLPVPKRIDKSNVPKLDENDLEERFISGWGPGGQCVNKSVNCCQLKHLPTGLVVKVHQDRSLEKNRKIAREILASKLDDLYNGEMSVGNQKKRLALHKIALRDAQRQRTKNLKDESKKLHKISPLEVN